MLRGSEVTGGAVLIEVGRMDEGDLGALFTLKQISQSRTAERSSTSGENQKGILWRFPSGGMCVAKLLNRQ
jgi:hypothetical protein